MILLSLMNIFFVSLEVFLIAYDLQLSREEFYSLQPSDTVQHSACMNSSL